MRTIAARTLASVLAALLAGSCGTVREGRQPGIEERVFLPRAPRAVASPVLEELELRRVIEDLLPHVNVEEARTELRRMVAEPRLHGRQPGRLRVVLASWGSGPVALEEIGREYRAWCAAVHRTHCHEVQAAGQRYGRLVGAQTARILVLLATAAIAQGGLIARLMKLPRATQASTALAAETGGVSLEAVGAVKEVGVLQGGVSIAVEGVAMGAVAVAMASHDALESNGTGTPLARAAGGGPKIHMGRQGKHIPGHNNFEPGRSILRADPESLASRAGTGTQVGRVPVGQPGSKERVVFDDFIGEGWHHSLLQGWAPYRSGETPVTPRSVERTLVLLSLQRALLGEVFPALRAVTVEWSDKLVKFWAYVDGPLTEEDSDSLSAISAEVAADFWSGVDIDYEVVRLDWPKPIEDSRTRVFHRRELA